MPNLSGFELMERLRIDPTLRNIPIFVFSHRGKDEDKQKAFALGAADFLVYGFATPNDIADTVKRFMGGRSTYHLKLDLRFLDGPNFRRDFKDALRTTDTVPITVEIDRDHPGQFNLKLTQQR